jgi:nucleotide-binding universal stress UspA family protein
MSMESERRIVVGIDDSPAGLAALQWAVSQAMSCQARLVAVRSWALGLPRHGGRRHRHLAHPRVVLFFNGAEQRDASAKLVRDAFLAATGGQPRDVTVTVRTPEGDPGAVLTGIATRADDLIVVGQKHRPAWWRGRRASVSRYCRLHAGCPVVVVPTEGSRHDNAADICAGGAAVSARHAASFAGQAGRAV